MATFYELFAGIGLVREALEPLGWECVYANDFDKSKQAIYEARYDDFEHFDPRSVEDVEVAELPKPVDLVTASFPCIDLSLAGKREGLAGTHSSTFWEFIRIMQELENEDESPRAVMIENVTGFLTSHGGEDFRMAVRALNDLDYRVDVLQVNAENFTPQSRPRLFVLGVREDLADALMTTPEDGEEWSRAVVSNPPLRPQRIQDLMLTRTLLPEDEHLWGVLNLPEPPVRAHDLLQIVDWEEADWWSAEKVERALNEMAPLHQAKVERMVETGGLHAAAAYRRRRNGRSVYEVRTDGLAGCLRTARGGSSKQILIIVEDGDVRMRWMSPREYASLQGSEFSEELNSFSPIALRSAYGDAVCVPAVSWVAEHAFGDLLEAEPQEAALAEAYGD